MAIPNEEENPKGFRKKYIITKADGTELDKRAEFFILRLDPYGHNPVHINACRRAVLAYADAIAATKPEMALDLYGRYNAAVGPDKVMLNPEPHF